MPSVHESMGVISASLDPDGQKNQKFKAILNYIEISRSAWARLSLQTDNRNSCQPNMNIVRQDCKHGRLFVTQVGTLSCKRWGHISNRTSHPAPTRLSLQECNAIQSLLASSRAQMVKDDVRMGTTHPLHPSRVILSLPSWIQ